MFSALVFVLVAITSCTSSELSEQHKSSLPSPVRYFHLPEENSTSQVEEGGKGVHEPRFGVQLGYGNDLQGYSGGSAIGYTPLKIDLGGLVLGTVIGLGAVLLAPKIFHILSSGHHAGPYARSEGMDVISNIGSAIARIDERLQEHEIDTTSCLEKAACTLVRSVGTARDIISNSSNPILGFLIGGSKLKAAMDRGIKGEDCAEAYPHCTISSSSLWAENKI